VTRALTETADAAPRSTTHLEPSGKPLYPERIFLRIVYAMLRELIPPGFTLVFGNTMYTAILDDMIMPTCDTGHSHGSLGERVCEEGGHSHR
jgi:hypothetical protein